MRQARLEYAKGTLEPVINNLYIVNEGHWFMARVIIETTPNLPLVVYIESLCRRSPLWSRGLL